MNKKSPGPIFRGPRWLTMTKIQLVSSLVTTHLFILVVALRSEHWLWFLLGTPLVDLVLFLLVRREVRRMRQTLMLKQMTLEQTAKPSQSTRSVQQTTEIRFAGILLWRRSTVTVTGTNDAL